MLKFIDSTPLSFFVILSLFLGLAPFFPEPHLVEKLRMLINGELVRPIDMFDFIMHGTPWVLLIIKISLLFKKGEKSA